MSKAAPERLIPSAIACVCTAAVAGALTLQYGFGLEPCILCKFERIPYLLAMLLASLSLTWIGRPAVRILIGLCALIFAAGAALAFYHLGVEGHWWASPTCAADPSAPLSLEDIKRALTKPADVPCDRVQWSLWGISLTGYNMLLSLLLATACAGAFANVTWWRKPDAR